MQLKLFIEKDKYRAVSAKKSLFGLITLAFASIKKRSK
jgi:hypothetical protein